MARRPSAMDVPFYADVRILAQRRRGLLRNPDKAETEARRLSVRRRPASRDQPLPRRAQSAIAALHVDRRSRQNHRRRQARVPSVRFDPLDRVAFLAPHEFGELSTLTALSRRMTRRTNQPALIPSWRCVAPFWGITITDYDTRALAGTTT